MQGASEVGLEEGGAFYGEKNASGILQCADPFGSVLPMVLRRGKRAAAATARAVLGSLIGWDGLLCLVPQGLPVLRPFACVAA